MKHYMKMKKTNNVFGQKFLLLLPILFSGSSWAQSLSADIYAEAWLEVLESQAWKDALVSEVTNTASEDENYYVSNEDLTSEVNVESRKTSSNSNFDLKYDALVRRAYIKIIAEAEKSDTRLEKEYILRNAVALKKGKKRSREFEQRLELVNKRYHAHRKMLEGLKSWNIFSDYGTNDLDFFKAENKVAVQEMFSKGKNEASVVNYLIYKLADLYHFES